VLIQLIVILIISIFFRQPQSGGSVISGSSSSLACPAVTYIPSFEREADNPNILTVNFTVTSEGSMVSWVDFHITINSALLSDGKGAYSPSYNYRMQQVNSTVFTYTFPGADGVSIPSTSYIDYFFTYCAMSSSDSSVQTDCNTEPGTFGASLAVGTIQAESKVAVGSGGTDTTGANNSNGDSDSFNANANSAVNKSVGSAFIVTMVAVLVALIL